MGKYADIISEAKVALADIGLNFINGAEGNLKTLRYCEELKNSINVLSKFENSSVFSKIKDIMIDNEEDAERERAMKNAVSLTARIKSCGICKCSSCVNVSERCGCEGCILGSYVTDCDQKTEKRKTMPGICYVDGMEVKESEYNRNTNEIICTVTNKRGADERYKIDIISGKSYPI